MPLTFKSATQERTYSAVVKELRALGYRDELLAEDYRFGDWFAPNVPERIIAAAAFGQTPVSYDSALFGIAIANGISGKELASQYRALGAPIIFEIGEGSIREWAIGRDDITTHEIAETEASGIPARFAENASEWTPAHFLRSKNIGDFKWNRQLELFSGLLPELESHIQEKLSPLLRDAMSATSSEYRKHSSQVPNPEKLFQLIFWMLTAKVFSDRGVNGFKNINQNSEADDILASVARHYKQEFPKLLNKQAREAARQRVWRDMNFRNLSVDVLAQIWSTALVTEEIRKQLGIHRTPRTIAKYLVDRIEFENVDDTLKTILEPCCGSAVFLIAAMNRLRPLLWGFSSQERHHYFTRHLEGFEIDPFGVEISRLALTLADFPNANGWKIEREDAFARSENFSNALRSARIVLCNPPFESFTPRERAAYGAESDKKPVELLYRVLQDLHPSGAIGFVLPRNVIDGLGYRKVRRLLAKRFASIEVTTLPDQAFAADQEIALVIAQHPVPHIHTTVRHRQVVDTADDWQAFEWHHEVSSEHEITKSVAECESSLAIPQLIDIWQYLERLDSLSSIAELHRGIEWNLPLTKHGMETGNREILVSDVAKPGFALGVPPGADVFSFTTPTLKYLDLRQQHQRGGSCQYEVDPNYWTTGERFLDRRDRSL